MAGEKRRSHLVPDVLGGASPARRAFGIFFFSSVTLDARRATGRGVDVVPNEPSRVIPVSLHKAKRDAELITH